jgi:hypothetical protein
MILPHKKGIFFPPTHGGGQDHFFFSIFGAKNKAFSLHRHEKKFERKEGNDISKKTVIFPPQTSKSSTSKRKTPPLGA